MSKKVNGVRDPHTTVAAAEQPKMQREARRPMRIPMNGNTSKLTVGNQYKREGYQLYWGIDKPGFIEKMEAAWWSCVSNEDGQRVTIPAGQGFNHVLMEIEQKWYDEDQAAAQEMIPDLQSQHLKVNKEDGEYTSNKNGMAVQRDII